MKTKRLELGVMQGRLLPKYKGRYQAHPVNSWKEEFPIAASFGLDLIEFILDFNDAMENPLSTHEGVKKIDQAVAASGVRVKSICADYFMEAPLHSADENVAASSLKQMRHLLSVAADLGVTDIVLPCVDQSSIQSEDNFKRLVAVLLPLADLAAKKKVNIALETDLNPKDFRRLLEHLEPAVFTVNYDTGNSASLGFSPVEELEAYSHRISDIHIKDRKLGSGSCVLGTGDTKFGEFFTGLNPGTFHGHFIMQAFRDDEGLAIFAQQLAWVRPKLEAWHRGEGWI